MASIWWLLLCMSVRVRGKLEQPPDLWYLETFNNGDTTDHSRHSHAYPQRSSAEPRVLAVDLPLQSAVASLRLRNATQQETELFEEIVEPLILVPSQRRLSRRSGPRVVTSRGRGGEGGGAALDDQQLVDQIRNIVNKFIARGAGERGQELADAVSDETNPTLTVYVRGPYGVLVLNAETHVHQWVLRPPSPLPRWLHASSAAGSAGDQRMPREVQSQFYQTLLRLVKAFLRFDL